MSAWDGIIAACASHTGMNGGGVSQLVLEETPPPPDY